MARARPQGARWSSPATSTSRRARTTSGTTSYMSKIVSHTPVEVEAMARAAGLAGLHRPGARGHPRAAEAVHLVELSRRRLPRVQPRPAARPPVDLARPGAAARRPGQRRGPGPRRRARMGTPPATTPRSAWIWCSEELQPLVLRCCPPWQASRPRAARCSASSRAWSRPMPVQRRPRCRGRCRGRRRRRCARRSGRSA